MYPISFGFSTLEGEIIEVMLHYSTDKAWTDAVNILARIGVEWSSGGNWKWYFSDEVAETTHHAYHVYIVGDKHVVYIDDNEEPTMSTSLN